MKSKFDDATLVCLLRGMMYTVQQEYIRKADKLRWISWIFKEKSIYHHHISPGDYIEYIIIWYIIWHKGTMYAIGDAEVDLGYRILWKCYVG